VKHCDSLPHSVRFSQGSVATHEVWWDL